MKRLVMGALGALSLLASQTPASAESVTVTASGTVAGGWDTTGVFGAAGSNLDGAAFSYKATYNLAHAGFDNFGTRSDLYGGAGYYYLSVDPPSLGGGVLKINGVSQTVSGQWNSLLLAMNADPFNFDQQAVQDYVNTSGFYQNNAVLLVESPAFGLFTSLDPIFPTGNVCATYSCAGGNFSFNETLNGVVTMAANGNLAPTSITFTVSSAPEASIWALMLVGVGAVGGALRARRKIAAA